MIGLLNRALEQGDLPTPEYDHRIAAVGSATYTSELLDQLRDLPPEYAWLPAAAVAPTPAPPAAGRAGRLSLILGIVSLPTAFCVVGAAFGIAAVVLSMRVDRPRGLSPAMLGRVFGIIGVALSLASLAVLIVALNSPMGP